MNEILKDIDSEIFRITELLSVMSPEEDSYEVLTKRLGTLTDIRKEYTFRVDPNVVVNAVVTVGLGVAVMWFEKTDILTSKVFNWVRPR